jgi:hypothetical protein
MSYIDKDPENQELKAELLLSTYFPDVSEWDAQYGSFFSRNYSGDLRSCNAETKMVALSRNGMYDILPEKLFFDDTELRFLETRDFAFKLSEVYEEEKNIKAYFMPYDSYFFNQSLRLERIVTHILDNKTKLLLKLLFNYDIDAEENPYVKMMAPLLIHVTDLRADIDQITKILSVILSCKVECRILRPDQVLFIVNKLQLDSKGYAAFMKDLKPLFNFVQYWFMPMETECDYRVKDFEQKFILSDERALVLDYNTQI